MRPQHRSVPISNARRVHQRGWALIAVLAALSIVAFLARDSLTGYFRSATGAVTSETKRMPTPDREPATGRSESSQPAAPIDRARAVEDTVRRQHEDLSSGIDGAAPR